MSAVFRREMKAFFTSPIGYFVLALMFAFSGYFFLIYNIDSASPSLTNIFSGLFTIVILLILPILTMRLFSEEKRQKTDQALLTAPTSLTGIVMGKFLASLLVFALSLSMTLVFAVVIAFQVTPDWMAIVGNYLGLLLLGGMIISIGMFLSSLTESQFIAALGTFVVSFALMLVDGLSSLFSNVSWLVSAVNFVSISQRYNNFTLGVVDYDNVIFFLSMQALFMFLTVRVLDKKLWG